MPSGKTHDKITVMTAAAAVPIWWLYAPVKNIPAVIVTLAAYLFSGFWLSDDLDTNSIAYQRWGLLRWLWWPYQKLVPHRSWISHGLGVGPLLRVVYFLGMLWLTAKGIFLLLQRAGVAVNGNALLLNAWKHTWSWTLAHPTWALWAAIGLVLGGVTHSLADMLVSWVKRL
jgi:uncharacterized metal-binding protein